MAEAHRTTQVLIGERRLRQFCPSIRELRQRCGQQDDLTTDPEYFIAQNTLKGRRVAAVLISHNQQLEACVLFFEHCKLGMGLGLLRGGDYMGESLVAGPAALRLQYVHLAAQALLKNWRIHGVSLTVRESLEASLEVLGPGSGYRAFSERCIQHKLPLTCTYAGMLTGIGPRTRRSLAGKRQQLEKSAHVVFVPFLEPAQALETMLAIEPRSAQQRIKEFYHARYRLLRDHPDFFCMGMRLPEGQWLSILSGWRCSKITYIDLQMNDLHYKKESLSAVMRAFMLEHEIDTLHQQSIHFVGGCSLLLRRYCQPTEQCTDALLWRPCLRAALLKIITPRMKSERVFERMEDYAEGENTLLERPSVSSA